LSGSGDYDDEMLRRAGLDDTTIDDLLSGRVALDHLRDGRVTDRVDLGLLVTFLEDARSVARRSAPTPSTELAAILGAGLSSPGPVAAAERIRMRDRIAGLGAAAKAAIGVGVAVAAVTAAGAVGALPGPAQHAVSATVKAVTPFEFPDHASSHADFGKTVSSDATGATDGQHGVDGQSVSSTAANNGLDVARQTPAGDHVPSSVPPAHSDESSSSESSGHADDASTNRSSAGDNASDTPGADHVPPSIPPRDR